MENQMDEKIEEAVEILIKGIRANLKPPEALQQTQALLNMAHAKNLLQGKMIPKKQGAGT